MYEGKDGTIEDIITGGALVIPGAWVLGSAPKTQSYSLGSPPTPPPWGLTTVSLSWATVLKSVPFTARTAKRGSRFFCDAAHHDESNC